MQEYFQLGIWDNLSNHMPHKIIYFPFRTEFSKFIGLIVPITKFYEAAVSAMFANQQMQTPGSAKRDAISTNRSYIFPNICTLGT